MLARMRAAVILVIVLTACSVKVSRNGETAAAQAGSRLVGTWELVSTRATRNDSVVMQGGPPGIVATKVLNATDYAVITKSNGQFARAGGGRYTLSGSTYTEFIDIASAQYPPNHSAVFTIQLDGDTWTTEGGTSRTKFQETWRRVR